MARILIVDDEEKMRKLLSAVLGQGHQLDLAESVQQALALINQNIPDVIVTDIRMPGEDGISLLKTVGGKYPSVPVILITGHGDKKTAIDALKHGAFDYLEKPFDDDEFIASVERAVEYSKLKNENDDLMSKLKEATVQLIEMNENLDKTGEEVKSLSSRATLGEMATEIVHEINGPLMALQILTKKLRSASSSESNELRNILETVQKAEGYVEKMNKIVKGVRALSGNSLSAVEEVDLDRIVTDAASLCESLWSKNGVRFIYSSEQAKSISIEAHSVQLSQVLVNLMKNSTYAIKNLPEKWIQIEVLDGGGRITIMVTDSGAGIPKDIREKIFQPHFTTKGAAEGSGVGLSISKKIILAHQGDISLDPNHANTRFVIQLPKKQPLRKAS